MKQQTDTFSRYLLLVNCIFNALGAVILFIAPGMLIERFGLGDGAAFLVYLLAVCSLSLAVLSFLAYRYKELLLTLSAAITFMAFHFISALVSIWYVCFGGGEIYVWANTGVHVLFGILFSISFHHVVLMRKRIAPSALNHAP